MHKGMLLKGRLLEKEEHFFCVRCIAAEAFVVLWENEIEERRLKPLRPVATSALVRPVRQKTHSEKRAIFSEWIKAVHLAKKILPKVF